MMSFNLIEGDMEIGKNCTSKAESQSTFTLAVPLLSYYSMQTAYFFISVFPIIYSRLYTTYLTSASNSPLRTHQFDAEAGTLQTTYLLCQLIPCWSLPKRGTRGRDSKARGSKRHDSSLYFTPSPPLPPFLAASPHPLLFTPQ